MCDAAASGDRNVTNKEVENILKYGDLITAVQRMCNAQTKAIPVVRAQLEPSQNHSENT